MLQSRLITIFCVSALFFSIYAHIDKNSLSIKGGETFNAGDKVQITWKVAVFHNRQHIIYFSPGASQPWQKIDSLPEKQGVMDMSYVWTVPQTVTQSARIRIFQSFVPSPGEQTNDYTIVSMTFSITSGATAVIAEKSTSHTMWFSGQPIHSGVRFDLNGRRVDETYVAGVRGRLGVSRKFIGR